MFELLPDYFLKQALFDLLGEGNRLFVLAEPPYHAAQEGLGKLREHPSSRGWSQGTCNDLPVHGNTGIGSRRNDSRVGVGAQRNLPHPPRWQITGFRRMSGFRAAQDSGSTLIKTSFHGIAM